MATAQLQPIFGLLFDCNPFLGYFSFITHLWVTLQIRQFRKSLRGGFVNTPDSSSLRAQQKTMMGYRARSRRDAAPTR
jgi:hypothetical protein